MQTRVLLSAVFGPRTVETRFSLVHGGCQQKKKNIGFPRVCGLLLDLEVIRVI